MTVLGLSAAALDKIDRNPRRSYTLPGHFYYEPSIYEHEKDAIFYRTWQLAGHVSQLAAPGDFLTCEVGDESILVLRDAAGGIA